MATHANVHKAYIGIGSNLGDSLKHVTEACEELDAYPQIKLIAHSRWYQSKAVGPGEQDDYVNGAALLETSLSPEALLDAMQSIELLHQRVRKIRWGARTLDLDLILFDEQKINTERLTVPHPEVDKRNFVLRPLLDLDQQLALPDGRRVSDILHTIGTQDLSLIAT